MSTAAATVPRIPRQLSLPQFEGYTVPTARLSFGGGLELKLTSEDDLNLAAALKLGAELTVTIAIDDHKGEPLVLGARVTRRGHRFRKVEESDSLVSDYRIVINDVREGDEDDDPGEDE